MKNPPGQPWGIFLFKSAIRIAKNRIFANPIIWNKNMLTH